MCQHRRFSQENGSCGTCEILGSQLNNPATECPHHWNLTGTQVLKSSAATPGPHLPSLTMTEPTFQVWFYS